MKPKPPCKNVRGIEKNNDNFIVVKFVNGDILCVNGDKVRSYYLYEEE